jgi:hypothetical protein
MCCHHSSASGSLPWKQNAPCGPLTLGLQLANGSNLHLSPINRGNAILWFPDALSHQTKPALDSKIAGIEVKLSNWLFFSFNLN